MRAMEQGCFLLFPSSCIQMTRAEIASRRSREDQLVYLELHGSSAALGSFSYF